MTDITAETVQRKVKAAGITQACWNVTEKVTEEISVTDGDFSLYKTLYDNDISLTVYKDCKKGSSSVNKNDDKSIEGLVSDTIANAENSIADKDNAIAPDQGKNSFEDDTSECDKETLYFRIKEFLETLKADFPTINLMTFISKHIKVESTYGNTNGTVVSSRSGYYQIALIFTAQENGKTTPTMSSFFLSKDLEKPFIEMASVHKDLENCLAQLAPKPYKGKVTGTVILAPACTSEFFTKLCDNFASNQVILDKTSLWYNKIGKQVASSDLTVSFTAHDSRTISESPVTADGFLSKDFKFIDKGILNSYLLDLYTAKKTGFKAAPNDNDTFVIESGSRSLEEMIAGIKDGLIAGNFIGGNPDVNGEFSGAALNALEIKDGKITGAVNEVMVSGNLESMFRNISGISKESVNLGLAVIPYIAFDGMVISGK